MAKKREGTDAEDLGSDEGAPTVSTPPGLPDFGVGSNIFTTPTNLLGIPSFIGADGGTPGGLEFGSLLNNPTNLGSTTLTGSTPVFTGPTTSITFGAPSIMAPGNLSLSDLTNPWTQRTDITQLAPGFGTWNPATDLTTAKPDLSGITLQQPPVSNILTTPATLTDSDVTTASASDVTTLPAVTVSTTPITPQTMTGQIYQPKVEVSGASLGGSVATEAPGVTVMDPFQVTASNLPRANLTFGGQTTGRTETGGAGEGGGATVLPKMTVTGQPVQTPTMTTEQQINLLNQATSAWGNAPINLPPVKAETGGTSNVNPLPVTTPVPTITPPPQNVIVPPAVTVPPPTTVTPTTTLPPTSTPPPSITQTGTATPTTTTGTSSAMTERDLAKELEKTMGAFNQYRPEIQKMYGELYNQFMPKGLTAAEPGIINQYQADLARLQQRQAGMLSPEDVRQSQQSAREAYGARGQVMGKGAIGAEILNREAIRQQREDQARAALQSSYGNILNMANLQTGNLFSPIASLMSGTFNPLGAYPADVYGTNVNAQLARDIAQKNYEAAIRSAELQGSAAKSAANTSLFGDFLKAGATVKTFLACMPGDQLVDTPAGPVAVQDIKGGDKVIGYDGSVAQVIQVSSYVQDADRDFFTFHLSNGGTITVCDRHKIMDIPASEWVVGAVMGDAVIERIDRNNGVTTSYDLVTEIGGYRIAGVPVNSMIPEMLALTLQLIALKQTA